MSSGGHHAVFEDGSKIAAYETEGGYYRVTFTTRHPDERRGWVEETCEACPSLSVCESGRACVKETAFITEGLGGTGR
jgi:hypothetical protein